MEKSTQKQKLTLVGIARKLSSRGGAFVFAVLGVICQLFHTGLVAYLISSMGDGVKLLQAIMIALFLSCALLYFTLIADESNTKVRKQIQVFFYFEAFVNTWYYCNKLIFETGDTVQDMMANADWMFLLVAIPFAVIMPLTLKNYASEIRTNEPEENERIVDKFLLDEFKTEIAEMVKTIDTNSSAEDAITLEQYNMAIDGIRDNNKTIEDLSNMFTQELSNLNTAFVSIDEFIKEQSKMNTTQDKLNKTPDILRDRLIEKVDTLTKNGETLTKMVESNNKSTNSIADCLKTKVNKNTAFTLQLKGSDGTFNSVTAKIDD